MADFNKNTALDRWLSRKKKSPSNFGITPLPEGAQAPLSPGQQRLWLLQQMFPGNPFYHYAHAYRFRGVLHVEHLLESFQAIARRHQILQTTFKEAEGEIVQHTDSGLSIPVETIDLRHLPSGQQEEESRRITAERARAPFSLAKGPLIRLTVMILGARDHLVVLTMHHIIGDRWSLKILNEELATYYKLLQAGREIDVAPLDIQYRDYAFWERNQKENEEQLKYWLEKLSGELPVLQLPADHPRPAIPDFKGATISRKLSPALSEKIKALCAETHTTLFVLMLSVFKVLLHRYTGQEDLLVGTPFANRDKVVLENMAGFFNETLVLRSGLAGNPSFLDFLTQINRTTLEAFSNKNTSFETLVKTLKPQRQGAFNPLFQVMFLCDSKIPTPSFGENLNLEEKIVDVKASKFDLTLFIIDEGKNLSAAFEYASGLFEADTIERMHGHLETLLGSIVDNPQQRISALPMLTQKERKQLVFTWNDTEAPVPSIQGIHHFFEKNAKQHPGRIAVTFGNERLTYRELDEQANAVARALSKAGDTPNGVVGLYTERSLEMVAGILGILKSGGAYLPLDPDYPVERISYMLEDTGASVLLCQEKLKPQLPDSPAQIIAIEKAVLTPPGNENPNLVDTRAGHLAYIIYTSGSTGQPKGVPVTHQNLIHSTTARFHYYERQPGAFLLLSSFSFDSSVAGIFWTLCTGGTLALPQPRIEQKIDELAHLISQYHITHTLLLPSLYSVLLEYASVKRLASLQTVIVAGESCAAAVVRQHFAKIPTVALVNEYGPTEGTVWCTAHRIKPEDAFGTVPIGRPIPNVQHFILDANHEPVPVGIAGELFVGGAGIVAGYWNAPELTAKKFVRNPFRDEAEAKLYATGDLARYRRDGTIEFLGRSDQQVKIRGHRIELDEIREALIQMDDISEAVISVQNRENASRLIAYFTVSEAADNLNLRARLQEKLPAHMIPAAFVRLEAIPKLPNGKADRDKLPAPGQSDFVNDADYVALRTPVEKQLAQIWEEVLKIKPIGANDNFFEIGGDSISSIQVIAKAQQLGVSIAPHLLFEHPSIRELARFLERESGKKDKAPEAPPHWPSLVRMSENDSRPPLFCIHSGGAHVFFYRPLARHLAPGQPLYALQPFGADGKAATHSSIKEMAAFYIDEIRKVQPEGPYYLLGTCFSNAVGLEMANQLQSAGNEIALLVFVDSGPAHLLSAAIRGDRKTFQRFGAMLRNNNWKGIIRKFRNRFIRAKQKILAPFENEQERNLRLTIQSLNQLYRYYTWQPFDGKITFIRSSEFAGREDKDTHLIQWSKLAQQGLDVHVVPGHHKTLFDEPEVQGLAEKLKECIQEVSTLPNRS